MGKKKDLLFFLAVFVVYLCLGLGLSRLNVLNDNIYFGADNGRAYLDLTMIKATHYRITVHPLFLLLQQPLSLFISGIIQDKATAVIFLQSVLGAVNVCSIHFMLSKLVGLNSIQSTLLSIIYAFSFSNFVFVSIPETFLYAAFFLVLFWLFIFHIIKYNGFSVRNTELLLIFFGVTIFGITLTNYVQFIIGFLLYLVLLKGYSNRQKIIKFVKINFIIGCIVVLLAKIQQLTWRGDTPVFWDSLKLAAKRSPEFQEFLYMNWDISFEKTVRFVRDFFGHSFLAGSFVQRNFSGNYNPILFTDFSIVDIGFLLLIFSLFFFSLFYGLRKTVKKRIEMFVLLSVLLSYLFNVALHYVYGANESFIYSQHYLFLFILLFGMCLSKVDNVKIRNLITIGLLLFLVYEGFSNLMAYRKLVDIATLYNGISLYSVKKIFIKTIAMSAAIFMFFGAFYHLCKKSFRVELLNRENVPLLLIFSYLGLCFATTFFIYINYWKI